MIVSTGSAAEDAWQALDRYAYARLAEATAARDFFLSESYADIAQCGHRSSDYYDRAREAHTKAETTKQELGERIATLRGSA